MTGFLPETFDAYRPNLTPTEKTSERILEVFSQSGIDMSHAKWLGEQAARAMLVSRYESGGFLFEHDQMTSPLIIRELVKRAFNNLPDGFSRTLVIPTEDIGLRPSVPRTNKHTISVGATSRELNQERVAIKEAIEEHFRLKGRQKQWPAWDTYPDVQLFRFDNLEDGAKAIKILSDSPDLLPDNLILGPVTFRV